MKAFLFILALVNNEPVLHTRVPIASIEACEKQADSMQQNIFQSVIKALKNSELMQQGDEANVVFRCVPFNEA